MFHGSLCVLPVGKADKSEATGLPFRALHYASTQDLTEGPEELNEITIVELSFRWSVLTAVTCWLVLKTRKVLDVEVGRAGLLLTLLYPLPLRLKVGDLERDGLLAVLTVATIRADP